MKQSEQTDPVDSGRILIIDDHPTNIDVLYDYLSDLGYEVLVAEDGRSALERIQFSRPDIILLDIMMPDLDGFETCDRLKADPSTAEIPVIFVSALSGLTDKLQGFSAGAVDYITKPYQNQEVLARVRTHLSICRMRKTLNEQLHKLLEQNESLDAYARTVAHDLKNPLNLVLNFARLMEENPTLDPQSREDLQCILQSAERMNHIIHDLLLLAQLRKEDIKTVRVNMTAVVRHALDRLHQDFQAREVQLIEPPQWPDAMGHSAWVQAVWVNYLSNALKYGGRPARIELVTEEDDELPGFHLYGVKDNGQGVDQAVQSSVFEEFSRVGGESEEGHGIGLSIVRRIVQRLGGRVGMRNIPGGGCLFFFTLPKVPEA